MKHRVGVAMSIVVCAADVNSAFVQSERRVAETSLCGAIAVRKLCTERWADIQDPPAFCKDLRDGLQVDPCELRGATEWSSGDDDHEATIASVPCVWSYCSFGQMEDWQAELQPLDDWQNWRQTGDNWVQAPFPCYGDLVPKKVDLAAEFAKQNGDGVFSTVMIRNILIDSARGHS